MINYKKPVWVYRNLKHGKNTAPLYSVMQNGKVVAHRSRVLLSGVRFIVRVSGRNRVLKEGRKNVHAFAVGKYVGNKGAFGISKNGRNLPVRLTYNPYKSPCFTTYNGCPVKGAWGVLLNEHGITACYLE